MECTKAILQHAGDPTEKPPVDNIVITDHSERYDIVRSVVGGPYQMVFSRRHAHAVFVLSEDRLSVEGRVTSSGYKISVNGNPLGHEEVCSLDDGDIIELLRHPDPAIEAKIDRSMYRYRVVLTHIHKAPVDEQRTITTTVARAKVTTDPEKMKRNIPNVPGCEPTSKRLKVSRRESTADCTSTKALSYEKHHTDDSIEQKPTVSDVQQVQDYLAQNKANAPSETSLVGVIATVSETNNSANDVPQTKHNEPDNELDQSFECVVCMELFAFPTTLSCGHSFCFSCAVASRVHDNIKCALCRADHGGNLKPSITLNTICEMLAKKLGKDSFADWEERCKEGKGLAKMERDRPATSKSKKYRGVSYTPRSYTQEPQLPPPPPIDPNLARVQAAITSVAAETRIEVPNLVHGVPRGPSVVELKLHNSQTVGCMCPGCDETISLHAEVVSINRRHSLEYHMHCINKAFTCTPMIAKVFVDGYFLRIESQYFNDRLYNLILLQGNNDPVLCARVLAKLLSESTRRRLSTLCNRLRTNVAPAVSLVYNPTADEIGGISLDVATCNPS